MQSSDLLDELRRYVVADPQPFVVDLQRSEGMWLATVEGRMLFDWAGYYGAKLLGHNHPALYERDYVARLVRAANNKVANPDFLTTECLDYYRLIYQLAPTCMRNDALEVYAVNSGAEAVENMMKYLINLHLQRHPPSMRGDVRRRFIYFDQAFHGRTVFALNVTELRHVPVVTDGFRGFDQGNVQVPFPAVDTDAPDSENAAATQRALAQVEEALAGDPGGFSGIIVEPLQGAGGHRVAEPAFYRGLSEIAHRYGTFLGFDEVQTAGGQTGSFFAVDQFDLPHPPQAVAAAKKLACGVIYMLYPMDDRGVLDSTWGGALADMVRFVQEMRIVRDERLHEQVAAKACRLVQVLRSLARDFPDLIRNIRGMGLYQGFTMVRASDKARLIELALDCEDMVLLGAGYDSIRLRPSLSVTLGDIEVFGERLGSALARLRHR
jgi:L-lysine 6-transaminase